jgi:hypothetical protein
MKKILIASLLVVLAATSSFGADADSSASVLDDAGKTVVSGTSTIGKLSTGVHMAWITSDLGYAIITQHKNGVKAFGTAHDSTAITWKDASKGTIIAVPGAIGAGSVSGDGWTIM